MDETPPQYVREIAANIGISGRTLASFALRDEIEGTPDLLAVIATRGVMGYQQTLSMVRSILRGESSVRSGQELFDPLALFSLARLMLGRVGDNRDVSEAADIFQVVRHLRGEARLPIDADRLDAQSNLAAGNFDYVERILSELVIDDHARWTFETELLHPVHGRPGAEEGPWLASLNSYFLEHGLLGVKIAPGAGTPFDRLTVTVPESMRITDSGVPLVSVIVSTFKPGQSLRTAVGSLVNQTWSNLEILLVDDCSPPGFEDLVREAAAMDDRVSLIRMGRNCGTYGIRNHAMSIARGEFITFLDSDDWAHPQRIERQMGPLINDETLVASETHALRLRSDLGSDLTKAATLRKNMSSLLFRRSRVLDTVGGFDETRKASDTEFACRLEVVFGKAAIDNVPLPLGITQLTLGSLSRSEFRYGWMHEARVAYRNSFERWHRRIERGQESAYLDRAGDRRFAAPDRILHPAPHAPKRVDVLMVSDWRALEDRYFRADREVLALSVSGLTVAVTQAESARFATRVRGAPTEAMMALQEAGATRFAMWDEDLTADVIVLRDPELLNFTRQPDKVNIRADRVILVAGYPCRAPQGGWLTYDPAVVERHARELFRSEPMWLPANESIARDLMAEGATCEILPSSHFAVTDVRPRPFEALRGGVRPVVGTTGFDQPLKDRPRFKMLREMLPDNDDFDVRIRADRALVDRIRRRSRLPVNWLVTAEDEPQEFFRQLDFFVGMPRKSWGPELSWFALEAMAHGCVVILDPMYESQFADAAIYARPTEVAGAISVFAHDPERFGCQQSRGYDFCMRQASAMALQETVSSVASFVRSGKEMTAL